jgi:hypothetical protein
MDRTSVPQLQMPQTLGTSRTVDVQIQREGESLNILPFIYDPPSIGWCLDDTPDGHGHSEVRFIAPELVTNPRLVGFHFASFLMLAVRSPE